ncbi:hypothetical protein RRG08_001007 [Elysia crispata]|uniref:C-type lectin domain-containing protein n=1 Tax=Elysia crispata TaxID=231223 RepID=A0AAE1AWY0_9GAST|nr:hypothetical protein RRG08_001007 [Elysia crispata]
MQENGPMSRVDLPTLSSVKRPEEVCPLVSSTQASTVAAVCPSGWIDSGDGMCYQMNSVADNFKVTWHEASDDCKKKGTNLASFHNDDQFHAVLQKIEQFGPEAGNFWCGLHNFDQLTGYEWEDQSVMNYVRWHSSHRPGEGRCGEVHQASSDLAMLDCLKRRSWVCGAATGTNIIVPSVKIFPQPEKFGACDPLPRLWRKFKNSCYFFADGTGGSDDSLTWREARESCRRHRADLVSLDSDEENRFLQGMLTSGSQKSSVWIGLNELDTGLGYNWSNGKPLRWKLNWNVNEPNDYFRNEACVEMVIRNGRWNDQHCSVRQGFVCERPAPGVTRPPTPSSPTSGTSNTSSPQSGCPKGFSKLANKCYGIFGADNVSSRLTWAQANVACSKIGMQSQHAGLASVTSALENAFVTSLLRKHRVSSWLGLQRTPDGQYRWWDNQDFSFQHWNRDEPNVPSGQTRCVYMYGPAAVASRWNDVNCQELAAYVYQIDTDPLFPPVFRPPSSLCSYREGFQLYGDSCLKLSKNSVSWPEAEAECLSSMSSLVSVMDAYDQAKLFLLAKEIHSDIWLGLSDQMVKFANH